MGVGELYLPLACYSTWESRLCTSPRWHSRAGPGCGGYRQASLQGHEGRRAGPASCLLGSGVDKGEMPSSSTLTSRVMRMGGQAMSLNGSKHLGEQTLHLA